MSESPKSDTSGGKRARLAVEDKLLDEPLTAGQVAEIVTRGFQDLGIRKEMLDHRSQMQNLSARQEDTATIANRLVSELSAVVIELRGALTSHETRMNDQLSNFIEQQSRIQMLHQTTANQQQNLAHTQGETLEAFRVVESAMNDQQQRFVQYQQSNVPASSTDYCPMSENTHRNDLPVHGHLFDPTNVPLNSTPNANPVHGQPMNVPTNRFDHGGYPSPVVGGSFNPYSNTSNDNNVRSQNAPMVGGQLRSPAISNSKITAPPVFNSSNFLNWRKDYEFWRDLYWYIEDGQILSVTGIHSSPQLKKFMIRFIRESRANSNLRTVVLFLDTLESYFPANNRERQVTFLDDLMSLRRESGESIQQFWFRHDEVRSDLDGYHIDLPESLMFVRMLKAIGVSAHIRLSIITRLDCRALEHNLQNLRLVPIELLGVYKDMLGKSEGAMTVEDSNDLFMDNADPDMVLSAAKKKMRKPGMEVNSMRNAQALSNLPNRSNASQPYVASDGNRSGIICYRCGQKDHVLKDCPLPFQRQLMFAPAKGKGKGNVPKETLVSETV